MTSRRCFLCGRYSKRLWHVGCWNDRVLLAWDLLFEADLRWRFR